MTPPTFEQLIARLSGPDEFARIMAQVRPLDAKGRYLHWDEMRNRTPPDDLSHNQWWLATSVARRSISRALPLQSTNGQPFHFSNVDPVQELVHRIDQQASGQILTDEVVTDPRSSDRYLVSSLVEEAITSSQLEGASTTRRVAKELLASGRPPRDRSEQMIVNNFHAMGFASELAAQPLRPADVLELHRVVTADALDEPDAAGRLQGPADERVAVYWTDNTVLHRPPAANELPQRLQTMCEFANGVNGVGFVHPVVRSIVLHFWLAYDHPFLDGNGRTARALFYWSMLRQGYWLAQYLSVSSILRKAPAQYARSFLLTETDDNDLTYFVIYQLGVIERAITSLQGYLARKVAEAREVEALLHGSPRLNHRQMLVVRDVLRDPEEPFTINAQKTRNGVTYQSARTDLLGLEDLGLLIKQRVGKKFVFHAAPDFTDRLRHLGH